jgi:hypothetical protein
VRASVPDITSQVIDKRADGTVDRQKSRQLILTFCPALNSIRQIFLHAISSCKVSTWLVSLVNLEYLDIIVKDIGRKDLELIGNIPNPFEFRMSLTGSRHKEPIIIRNGFQRLQKFRFDSFTRGQWFMVEEGAMPLLNAQVLS